MPLSLKVIDPFEGTGDEVFEVWLDPGPDEFEGVCIGVGPTRELAMLAAAEEMTRAVEVLCALMFHERPNASR